MARQPKSGSRAPRNKARTPQGVRTRFCIRVTQLDHSASKVMSHHDAACSSPDEMLLVLLEHMTTGKPFGVRTESGDLQLLLGLPSNIAVEAMLWEAFVKEQADAAASRAAEQTKQQLG